MNVKIAVCDDEIQQTEYIKSLVGKWAGDNNITVTVDMFENAEKFKEAWSNDKNYDILLLDIEMGGQNGVELAKEIRQSDIKLCIIFITGFADYMSEGYDVSALHYLMKPVKETKLFEVLDRVLKKLNKAEKTMMFSSTDGESIPVLISGIMFAESLAHYSEITVLQNSKITKIRVKMTLNEIECNLNSSDFVKCHRSYIVGLKHVKKIIKTDIILDNDTAVPISRRLYDSVNQAAMKFFMEDK